MSRIVFPTIAATCVALYFISRKRKIAIDIEIEPAVEKSDTTNLADTAILAE